MELKLQKPLAIFDLEATGANIATDRIVEIYILKIKPDGTKDEFMTRVNPRMPIPPEVSEIHGITDEDVKDSPSFLNIAFELKDFLEGCDLGGYNSNRFDVPLLLEEFYRIGINWDLSQTKFVDVFKIFTRMEGRDLSSAYKFYCKKELENAHAAKNDVIATYEVLKAQLERYQGDLENDVDFLHEFTYESHFVDTGRRLIRDGELVKFNFGKHKGKTVEQVLQQEPQYYNWIMKSDFLMDTKQKLTELRNAILDRKKKEREAAQENAPKKNSGGGSNSSGPIQPTLF